jgi:hypothetical protein
VVVRIRSLRRVAPSRPRPKRHTRCGSHYRWRAAGPERLALTNAVGASVINVWSPFHARASALGLTLVNMSVTDVATEAALLSSP